MQTLNYWKQFENTGRIEDYLSYREECQGRQGAEKDWKTSGHREQEPGTVRQERTGNYAGVHTCDRNDLKTEPLRGV